MATQPGIKPKNLGSMAAGVNNRRQPTEMAIPLPGGAQNTYLTTADNIDITQGGNLKRRRGTTLALPGRAHSVWSDAKGAFAVFDGDLCALTPSGDGLARSTVRAGVQSSPLSYSRGADGAAYWTNGAELRRVVSGTDRPAVTPPPNPVPSISVTAGGLRAGQYLVAFTRDGFDGESPATIVRRVDVPENGGIAIASATPVEVYVSAPGGDVLTWQASLTTGAVVTHNENSRRCATLNTDLMPPGSIVRHYKGAMLVAAGSILYVSLPYYYGVFNPSKGYVPFPADITVVEPTDKGVYICADQTYFLADLLEQSGPLNVVLPYPGIRGTSGQAPESNTVFWQSERGLIVADDSGTAKAVQEDRLRLSPAQAGATLFREQDGATHIVTSRAGAQPSRAAATSFMEATIVRRGTTL